MLHFCCSNTPSISILQRELSEWQLHPTIPTGTQVPHEPRRKLQANAQRRRLTLEPWAALAPIRALMLGFSAPRRLPGVRAQESTPEVESCICSSFSFYWQLCYKFKLLIIKKKKKLSFAFTFAATVSKVALSFTSKLLTSVRPGSFNSLQIFRSTFRTFLL